MLTVGALQNDVGVQIPIAAGEIFTHRILSTYERFVIQPGTWEGDGASGNRTVSVPSGVKFNVDEFYPAMQGLVVGILLVGDEVNYRPDWDRWSSYQYHWEFNLFEGGIQITQNRRGAKTMVDHIEIPPFALRELTSNNTVYESADYRSPCVLHLKVVAPIANILGTNNVSTGYTASTPCIVLSEVVGVRPDGYAPPPLLELESASEIQGSAFQEGILDLALNPASHVEQITYSVPIGQGAQASDEHFIPLVVRLNAPAIPNSIVKNWPTDIFGDRKTYIDRTADLKVAAFLLYVFVPGDGPVSEILRNSKLVAERRQLEGGLSEASGVYDDAGEWKATLFDTGTGFAEDLAETTSTSFGALMMDMATDAATLLLGAVFAALKTQTWGQADTWESFLNHWAPIIVRSAIINHHGDSQLDLQEYLSNFLQARENAGAAGVTSFVPAMDYVDLFPAQAAGGGKDSDGYWQMDQESYTEILSSVDGRSRRLTLDVEVSSANPRVKTLRPVDNAFDALNQKRKPTQKKTIGYTKPIRSSLHESELVTPVWLVVGKDTWGVHAATVQTVLYEDKGLIAVAPRISRDDFPHYTNGSAAANVDLTDIPYRNKGDASLYYSAQFVGQCVGFFDADVDQVDNAAGFNPVPYVSSHSDDSSSTATWGNCGSRVVFRIAPQEEDNISVSNPDDPNYCKWSEPLHGIKHRIGVTTGAIPVTTAEMFPNSDAIYTNTAAVYRGFLYVVREPDAATVDLFSKSRFEVAKPRRLPFKEPATDTRIARNALRQHDSLKRRNEVMRRSRPLRPYKSRGAAAASSSQTQRNVPKATKQKKASRSAKPARKPKGKGKGKRRQ